MKKKCCSKYNKFFGFPVLLVILCLGTLAVLMFSSARQETVALGIAILALGISLWSFRSSSRGSQYDSLVSSWNNFLKLSMKYPLFSKLEATRDYANWIGGDDYFRYDAYARLVWGFWQDVYRHGFQVDPYFQPSLLRHKAAHGQWLSNNSSGYDKNFLAYLESVQ